MHVNETTITFPFAEAQAKEVVTAINSLLQTFAAKQAAERPKRWQSMEYRYKGALYWLLIITDGDCVPHSITVNCNVYAAMGQIDCNGICKFITMTIVLVVLSARSVKSVLHPRCPSGRWQILLGGIEHTLFELLFEHGKAVEATSCFSM